MDGTRFNTLTGFPAGTVGVTAASFPVGNGTATVLAGIRAGGSSSIAFPGALFQARPVALRDESGISREILPLTVAGAAQVKSTTDGLPSCFPLNCGM